MFNIGPGELILILLLALIVFGPARLPEVGRTIGRSLREFRRASSDIRDEIQRTIEDDDFTGGYGTTPPARPTQGRGSSSNGSADPVDAAEHARDDAG